MHRARHALVELGKRLRQHPAACFVVTAVEPDLGAVADIGMEGALDQALEPRRPFGMGDAEGERLFLQLVAEHEARGGNRISGIVDLMASIEPWQGEGGRKRPGSKKETCLLLV